MSSFTLQYEFMGLHNPGSELQIHYVSKHVQNIIKIYCSIVLKPLKILAKTHGFYMVLRYNSL